jgi:hypothetical protein
MSDLDINREARTWNSSSIKVVPATLNLSVKVWLQNMKDTLGIWDRSTGLMQVPESTAQSGYGDEEKKSR